MRLTWVREGEAGWSRNAACLLSHSSGMRCLPASKLPQARGQCLHDWHAEVVAIRGLNHFLLRECFRLASDASATSSVLARVEPPGPPFTIRDDILIHMYCSEAPCGDASMELVMSAQDDATPWQSLLEDQDKDTMPGRGYFSKLGIVRRKPARGDAPETLSKSCSDKLSMKQCTSLLSSLTSLFVCPSSAYLDSLVLPSDQHSKTATTRAFSATGRMAALMNEQTRNALPWVDGYSFHPLDVHESEVDFAYSKKASAAVGKVTGSNITAFWNPFTSEVLIGGTLQGHKQFATRGASQLSRQKLWALSKELAASLQRDDLASVVGQTSYRDVKASQALAGRQQVKETVRHLALRPWVRNTGDDDWAQESG